MRLHRTGFRLVEKYALLVGGAATHRYDLSSMVMLKGESSLSPPNHHHHYHHLTFFLPLASPS